MVDIHHRYIDGRYHGTIRSVASFHADEDCQALHKALKRVGSDDQTIINILCHRTLQQRMIIRGFYQNCFHKDLIHELKSDLRGDFEEVIEALMTDPSEYNVHCLNRALKGLGTNEKAVTEIICTRTNEEIREMRAIYFREYKKELDKEITSDTSGLYRKILLLCLQGNRVELTRSDIQNILNHGYEAVVDREEAKNEAKEIAKMGIKKWASDENAYTHVVFNSNPIQIRATFDEYMKLTGKTFTQIHHEFAGDAGEALATVILSQISLPLYYAKLLYDGMKGLGTRDHTLIRVVVTRAEIDLEEIKEIFYKCCGDTLRNFIDDDTSGDYKKALLTILG